MNLLRVKWGSKLSASPVFIINKIDVLKRMPAEYALHLFLFGKLFNMQSDIITNIKEKNSPLRKYISYNN